MSTTCQFAVTNGKVECSILATDAQEALDYYQNRRTEAFGNGQGLWISGVRTNGASLWVNPAWLDWTIPNLR